MLTIFFCEQLDPELLKNMDVAQENVLALNLGRTGAWPRANQSIAPFQAVLVFVLFTLRRSRI